MVNKYIGALQDENFREFIIENFNYDKDMKVRVSRLYNIENDETNATRFCQPYIVDGRQESAWLPVTFKMSDFRCDVDLTQSVRPKNISTGMYSNRMWAEYVAEHLPENIRDEYIADYNADVDRMIAELKDKYESELIDLNGAKIPGKEAIEEPEM